MIIYKYFFTSEKLMYTGFSLLPMRQRARSAPAAMPQSFASQNFLPIFYHKQKCLLAMAFLCSRQCGSACEVRRQQCRKVLLPKTFCRYFTISKNACLQWHFCAAVNAAARAKCAGGNAAKFCSPKLSADIIPYISL